MLRKRGFTLVEVLVAVAIIGILAGVVGVAVQSARVSGRNSQRASDTALILNAVYQYALDNSNQIPSALTTATTSICRTGASSCTGLIDLSVLTASQKYLPSIPTDPISTSSVSAGYSIVKSATGRVTVVAPLTEGTTTPISITR